MPVAVAVKIRFEWGLFSARYIRLKMADMQIGKFTC